MDKTTVSKNAKLRSRCCKGIAWWHMTFNHFKCFLKPVLKLNSKNNVLFRKIPFQAQEGHGRGTPHLSHQTQTELSSKRIKRKQSFESFHLKNTQKGSIVVEDTGLSHTIWVAQKIHHKRIMKPIFCVIKTKGCNVSHSRNDYNTLRIRYMDNGFGVLQKLTT